MTYKFRIASSYVIPKFKKYKKREAPPAKKYHLDKMKVGHSFAYTGSKAGALSLIWQYTKKTGFEFVTAMTRYGNRRIWRVA